MTDILTPSQAAREHVASLEQDGRERDQILRGKRDKGAKMQEAARFEQAIREGERGCDIPSASVAEEVANAVAKIVADKCHGDRKPNAAPERYATIYQAARLGVIEHLKPSTGVPCELCGRSVRLGHYVNLYDDIGEAHVNCDAPDLLPEHPTPSPSDDGSVMKTFRMLGSPLMLKCGPAATAIRAAKQGG